MNNTLFNNRIEKKYQIGIGESEVAGLCSDLSYFLNPYRLYQVQDITSVGSIYLENRDCDVLRYSLFGPLMLMRLRAYERYDRPAEPITEYWVEVKTAEAERRNKRRFRLPVKFLPDFMQGRDADREVLDFNRADADQESILALYRDAQETMLSLDLRPLLLVVYNRIAFQSEVERLSIDWDMRYYYVSSDGCYYRSWKHLEEPAAGRSNNVILEIKYLQGATPPWLCNLQKNYPIRRREYLKPVEGMGFLFNGPLKHHPHAGFFSPLIAAYLKNSELG